MRVTYLPVVLGLLAVSAQGQVLIRVQQDNNVSQVANGGTVSVAAAGVNQPKTLQITITYTGATSLAFPQLPRIFGSQDFSITVPPPANVVLTPNQSLTMELRYLPTSSQQALAELDYDYAQAGQPTQPSTPGLVVIGLNGTVPDYSVNYSLPVDDNLVNLPANGVLSFTDTIINGTSSASMLVVNRGSGIGRITSVTTTGDTFSLVSLPLLPSAIQAGASFSFQLRYRPRQPRTDSGTLTISFEGGATFTANLRGRGVASYLTYELLPPEGTTQPISPSQAVVLPATIVGERTTVFIRMRNSSELDIAVNAIAITGASFQLSDLPFLPLTLAPGDVQLFSVIFSPTQAGRQSGRLRVGSDTFELTGDGIGPILSYSYQSFGTTVALQPLGTVVFPGAQIGESSTVELAIRNSGTAPASLVSVAVVSEGTPVFTIAGLPALPAVIAPNSTISLTVRFAPLNTTLTTASLRINGDAFTLQGIGNTPAPLPDYTLVGPSTVQAFEQPRLSLSLAATYAVALTGTVTLSTESESFASDPSVQFVNGTRVATFTIPAGSRDAVFSNGSTQIRFQTGSVAGSIYVTPTFATEGGLDLTPRSPKRLQMTLAPSAPRLVSLSIDSRTANGFTIQAVGVSTTRSLAAITVTFKGKEGYNFPRTEFTQDLTASSFLWFGSQDSIAFGGQFVIPFPFSVTNSDTSDGAIPPIQTIESVTVTVTNQLGASNALTALVQ